ncbi:zinc-finger domain-containing protein, partial [archaeon]
ARYTVDQLLQAINTLVELKDLRCNQCIHTYKNREHEHKMFSHTICFNMFLPPYHHHS